MSRDEILKKNILRVRCNLHRIRLKTLLENILLKIRRSYESSPTVAKICCPTARQSHSRITNLANLLRFKFNSSTFLILPSASRLEAKFLLQAFHADASLAHLGEDDTKRAKRPTRGGLTGLTRVN